jgi:hypothetical protein
LPRSIAKIVSLETTDRVVTATANQVRGARSCTTAQTNAAAMPSPAAFSMAAFVGRNVVRSSSGE